MFNLFLHPKLSARALSSIEKDCLRYFALFPVKGIAVYNVEEALQLKKEPSLPVELTFKKFNSRVFWENVASGLRYMVSKIRWAKFGEGADLNKTLDGLVRKNWLLSETEGMYARKFELNGKLKTELGINPKKCFPIIDSYNDYLRFDSEPEAANSMLYLEDAVSILTVLDDYSDLHIARLCAKAGRAYALLNNYRMAVKYQEKNIHIIESHRNYDEEELAFSYYHLSNFNYQLGEYTASKFYIDVALSLITKSLPSSSPEVKKFIHFKNNVYKACNKDRESEY